MGNIHRIKKQLAKQQMAMADTKVAFNNCKVYLSHLNPNVAGEAAKQFQGFMKMLNERASRVNMKDLYMAHFQICNQIRQGNDLIKLIEKGKEDGKGKRDDNS